MQYHKNKYVTCKDDIPECYFCEPQATSSKPLVL